MSVNNDSATLREDHPVLAATRQHLHEFFDDASQAQGVEPKARLAAEYDRMIEMLQWQIDHQLEKSYMQHCATQMKNVLIERHGNEAVTAYIKSMNEHYLSTLSSDQFTCFETGSHDKVH